ncbi:hypothetical protein E4U43_006562, partial [Claviceps pusilla]
MTATVKLDNDAIAQSGLAQSGLAQSGLADYEHHGRKTSLPTHTVTHTTSNDDDDGGNDNESHYEGKPTPEELRTLPRVSGKIKWAMWTIAFVELCERFSYYGSAVLYTNFVNHPLPAGSTTGADPSPDGNPGALGLGPKAAQGISLFNQFFAYLMPLLG